MLLGLLLDDRIIITELVLRIILGLQRLKPLQAPRLVAVHRLQRLIASSVVQVCRREAIWLTGIPKSSDLCCPLFSDIYQLAIIRDDSIKKPGVSMDVSIVPTLSFGGKVTGSIRT